MQLTALPFAALTLLNAAAAPQPHAEPQVAMQELQPFTPPGSQCRDNALPTHDVPQRQPRFEREPATPDSGQIIYAVDRRIDGCPVVVVKYRATDVQELQRRFDDHMKAAPAEQGK